LEQLLIIEEYCPLFSFKIKITMMEHSAVTSNPHNAISEAVARTRFADMI
jgi:hypothetical protein